MSATLMLALVLTAQTAPLLPSKPTPRRTDETRIQGTWETTIPGPRPEVKVRLRMDVIRDSFTWKLHVDDEPEDRVIKGRFQLNSGRTPAHIDLNDLNADGRSLPSLRAIYTFENNYKTLKILGPAGPDAPRPTRFTENDGSAPARLLVFQKQPNPDLDPAEPPDEPEKPVTDGDAPEADQTRPEPADDARSTPDAEKRDSDRPDADRPAEPPSKPVAPPAGKPTAPPDPAPAPRPSAPRTPAPSNGPKAKP